MRAARSAEARLPWRPGGRVIRAVTLDLWGTLFLDGPASDERYKRQRLAGIQVALAGVGITVPPAQLDRGYAAAARWLRSEEHTSELQSQFHLVCRLLLEKKK